MTIVRIMVLCLVVVLSFSVVNFAEKMLLSKNETLENFSTDESLGVFQVDGSRSDYGSSGFYGEFYFEKGMTWKEFIESDYNVDNQFILTGDIVSWSYLDEDTMEPHEALCYLNLANHTLFYVEPNSEVLSTIYYVSNC